MKRSPWVGLVCAGPVSRSGLARIPGLSEQLGWIKSTTIATAARAANALRCGCAVRDYESLAKAELILIQAPDELLPGIVDELVRSGVSWASKSVTLVHPVLEDGFVAPLERCGASIAALGIAGEGPIRYVVEGQPAAVRRVRRLFRHAPGALLEIHHGRKQDYLGGVYAATAEFIPLLASIVERFRRAGMHKTEAGAAASALVESSMKAYFRVGKRLVNQASRQTLAKPRA